MMSNKQVFDENIPWHPLFSRWIKGVLTPADVTVSDELKAISMPPRIDAILQRDGTRWTKAQRALLPDGIRDRHTKHHLLEFKITENVTFGGIEQAVNYDYLYRKSQTLKYGELQTYIISSTTPHKSRLQDWGYSQSRHSGVYMSSQPFFNRVIIISLNQLKETPYNQYFRLFASRKKVRESALHYLMQTYTTLAYQTGIDPSIKAKLSVLYLLYTIDKMGEKGLMTVDEAMELGWWAYRKSVIGIFKPEDVMPLFRPEERLAGLAPTDRLAGLQLEDMIILQQEIDRFLAISSMKEQNT
ncbi:MAG: hypothetical protein AAF639_21270 [Chloroflexota bacterium]